MGCWGSRLPPYPRSYPGIERRSRPRWASTQLGSLVAQDPAAQCLRPSSHAPGRETRFQATSFARSRTPKRYVEAVAADLVRRVCTSAALRLIQRTKRAARLPGAPPRRTESSRSGAVDDLRPQVLAFGCDPGPPRRADQPCVILARSTRHRSCNIHHALRNLAAVSSRPAGEDGANEQRAASPVVVRREGRA